MDIRKIKKLIQMLENSDIDEIEVREDQDSVRVSRNRVAPPAFAAPARELSAGAPQAAAPPAVAAVAAQQPEPPPAVTATEEEPEENLVKAPMVGIFYEAAAPGKPSFVELGQAVKKGDVLCIIEAMKVMNQIESERAGVVSRVMAVNGEPVEYGQPLFVIRAA